MATILLLLVLQTQVTGSISGVVLDTGGRPLPDAVVSIRAGSHHAGTDSLGRYHFDAVSDGYVQVMAWALGYKTAKAERGLMGGHALEVDFVLHPLADMAMPAGSVFGVIHDTVGRPVTGVEVAISGMPRDKGTDSLGQYHLDSVPAGPIRLLVRRVGYKIVRVNTTLAPGQPLPLDIVLHSAELRVQY